MNSTEALAIFREEMSDTELPYLWSDASVYRYMDDAQKMFCRLTEGIEDTRTVEIVDLAITPTESWYPVSSKILKLRKAHRADTGAEVPIYNVEKAQLEGIRFDGRTGPLKVLVSGYEKNTLRAWPIPNESVTVTLSVFRLPLTSITEEDQLFEVDEQHHEHLQLWMKHRAYSRQDSETFDKSRAAEFEDAFRAYCARARVEQERARRNTGVVAYGGI